MSLLNDMIKLKKEHDKLYEYGLLGVSTSVIQVKLEYFLEVFDNFQSEPVVEKDRITHYRYTAEYEGYTFLAVKIAVD